MHFRPRRRTILAWLALAVVASFVFTSGFHTFGGGGSHGDGSSAPYAAGYKCGKDRKTQDAKDTTQLAIAETTAAVTWCLFEANQMGFRFARGTPFYRGFHAAYMPGS